jgi:lysozyme
MNDALHISANGRAMVEHFEGLVLTATPDEGGVLTIGYGHTGHDVFAGQTITPETADQLLAKDMEDAEDDVKRLLTVPLTQPQFDALVSFHFNTGGLQISTGPSTVTYCLNHGQNWLALLSLLTWNHVHGRVLDGLTRRRNAEASLFCGFGWESFKL